MSVPVRRRWIVAVVGALVLLLVPPGAIGATPRTRLASVATDGTVATDFLSANAAISANGRYIVFESSTAFASQDTNDFNDIFLRDRVDRTTELVSVNSDEVPADGASNHPAISADGRYVAFDSFAANLAENDLNGMLDVFVRDTVSGSTERVSVSSAGVEGDGYSYDPRLSADGRFVVFTTEATNLVPNDTLGFRDVVIHDRETGRTRRVSVTDDEQEPDGDSQDATISADGNLVAFISGAPNMAGASQSHIFVRNRSARTTRLISVNSAEEPAEGVVDRPVISANGRFVVFETEATNLFNDTNTNTDIVIRDRELGTTRLVSRNSNEVQGNAASYLPWISSSGRFVTFTSDSTNLVGSDGNGVQEIFLRDRELGTTKRVSLTSTGHAANDYSDDAMVSGDGRFVAFESRAMLVAADTNAVEDIYVRGPLF